MNSPMQLCAWIYGISYEFFFSPLWSASAHMWHLVKEATECGSEVLSLLTNAARLDVSNISHIAWGPIFFKPFTILNFFYYLGWNRRQNVCRKIQTQIIHSLSFESVFYYKLSPLASFINVPNKKSMHSIIVFQGSVKFWGIKCIKFQSGSVILYLILLDFHSTMRSPMKFNCYY